MTVQSDYHIVRRGPAAWHDAHRIMRIASLASAAFR